MRRDERVQDGDVQLCFLGLQNLGSRSRSIWNMLRFDAFVDKQCARFYAENLGRPDLTPGICFRSLRIGYFEGIEAERGLPGACGTPSACGAFWALRWMKTLPIIRRPPARGG